jgi:hypothetical protein
MPYWIDAGVLIQAHRGYLTRSILPQFWEYLDEHLDGGQLRMPRLAYKEITEGGYDDELVAWCKPRKRRGLCVNETKAVQERYGQLCAYVQEEFGNKPQQARKWFGDADGWVIAYAMATGGAVVTEEHARSSAKSQIKIPRLCRAFDVECINTATLLRERLRADFSR